MHFLLPYPLRDKHRPVKVQPVYKSLLMPYAKGIQTSGDFGAVITQVFKGKDYEIWQHHFFIKESIYLTAYTDKPILTINFMLKGSPVATLPLAGQVQLAENTSQLFYVPALAYPVCFEKGNYHCIHIVFHPSYLKRLTTAHPCLQQLVNCALEKSSQILMHSSGKINAKMKLLIDQITYCRMDAGEAHLTIQAAVLSLLLQYIRRYISFAAGDLPTSKTDSERLQVIKTYIENNIERSFKTKDLAKLFCKSESEFYRMFKLTFEESPHHFIQRLRINRAKNLIAFTDHPINQIAEMVGFEDISNFNKTYRKLEGGAPGSLRKS